MPLLLSFASKSSSIRSILAISHASPRFSASIGVSSSVFNKISAKALTFTKGADVKEQYESGSLTKEQRKELEKQNRAAVKEVKKAEKMRRAADKKQPSKEQDIEPVAESK